MREEKKTQPGIMCLVKLFFKSEGKIKTFSDKRKLMEFVAKIPALQEIWKEVL